MNTLRFSTRQQMRTFVKRVNLCTSKKLFKSTAKIDGCGSWLAHKKIITNTLKAPSIPYTCVSFVNGTSDKLVEVTHKRSVRARMSLKA